MIGSGIPSCAISRGRSTADQRALPAPTAERRRRCTSPRVGPWLRLGALYVVVQLVAGLGEPVGDVRPRQRGRAQSRPGKDPVRIGSPGTRPTRAVGPGRSRSIKRASPQAVRRSFPPNNGAATGERPARHPRPGRPYRCAPSSSRSSYVRRSTLTRTSSKACHSTVNSSRRCHSSTSARSRQG